MQRASKRRDLITSVLIWAIIIIFGIGIFFLPAEDFSRSEGRYLASFPTLSPENLLDGSFFEGLSDFYLDRLPLREQFAKIYALCERSLGKREVNGTILCRNGVLVLRPGAKNENTLQANLNAVNSLCKSNSNTLFFAVPAPYSVFSEDMPYESSPKPTISNDCYAQFLSVSSTDPTKYYYKTDHHWTTHGAYVAYTIICQKLGIKAYEESFFEKQIVSQCFYGSAARRSSLPHSLIAADTIMLYRYDGDDKLILTDGATSPSIEGLYDLEELNGADGYRVFLGGNSAHVSIRSGDGAKRPKLLLLKDSYANSLLPFLALHYDVDVIDPRYAEPSQIKALCSSTDFDAILVLLGESTLSEDSSVCRAAEVICEYSKRP